MRDGLGGYAMVVTRLVGDDTTVVAWCVAPLQRREMKRERVRAEMNT